VDATDDITSPFVIASVNTQQH